MFVRQLAPPPLLQGVVEMFWQFEGPPQSEPQQHQQFAQHLWHLSFCGDDSWQLGGHGLWQQAPAAELQPLRLGSDFVTTRGYQKRMAAELYPWAVRQLFGWALDRPPELAAARESQAIRALLTLGEWDAALETLHDWLTRLFLAGGREGGKGVQAARKLYASPGGARIGDLAEELQVSQRQLEREFQAEIGVTPKTLARLVRFDAALGQLIDSPASNLATLAYDLGFADQSHLTREFRALTLMTPSAFLKGVRQRADHTAD